ncbi:MAG: hypothetical protein K0Q70_830 [Rhodospirillales bacterium]|nr:hypothetical protein [Rhodospirillales bacterium]
MSTSNIPADLQAAMRARDEAFYAVDSEQWGRYTSPTFTTVQQNGQFMTREERVINHKAQTVRPYVARSREQYEQQGDLVVTRFFSGGLWVLEVWKKQTDGWMVEMSHATTAKT